MANKRYYWLKLKNTYFDELEQRKMRKQKNGLNMQIIYLKLMLFSLDKEGYIYYQGIFETLEEELAEIFSEDVQIIKHTLNYLIKNNLIIADEKSNYFMPQVLDLTGSEGDSAERVRKHRALHCNNGVTNDMLQRNAREKREENRDKSIEEDCKKEQAKPARKRFIKPSLEELKAFNEEKQLNVDCDRFMDYYEANGWKAGRNPMKDWKAAMRNWSRNDRDRKKEKGEQIYDLPKF